MMCSSNTGTPASCNAIQAKRASQTNIPVKSYFAEEQTDHLRELITKYEKVIENKRADAISINAKAKAWQKLCAEYNSRPFARPRDAKQHEAKVEARESSSQYSFTGFTASRSDLTAGEYRYTSPNANSKAWFKNFMKSAALPTGHDAIFFVTALTSYNTVLTRVALLRRRATARMRKQAFTGASSEVKRSFRPWSGVYRDAEYCVVASEALVSPFLLDVSKSGRERRTGPGDLSG
ncbi:hypothetical protein HPB49_000150 [Dermacentor silvarum]|uniref:Uncharacterized protein n=1 Tax=Dermacentor silvarum TaxID=543639 RepID=A0ACB8CCF1_DERSI|nr:hypothetical protein HPB49_000150 [Dermacentor silvarum]